jgi:hypothetical protein
MDRQIIIVGDIINSRKNFNPDEWESFHEMIQMINTQYEQHIKTTFTVYAGDSFGGMVDDIYSGVKIILSIQEFLRPLHARIVMVEDIVSFGLKDNNFLLLEGPALWKSQSLLEELKKNSYTFLANLQDETKTATINTIINLILSIKNDWTDIEWKVYRLTQSIDTQKEIALKLNISPQYVSKIYNKLRLIIEIEQNLSTIFDKNKIAQNGY